MQEDHTGQSAGGSWHLDPENIPGAGSSGPAANFSPLPNAHHAGSHPHTSHMPPWHHQAAPHPAPAPDPFASSAPGSSFDAPAPPPSTLPLAGLGDKPSDLPVPVVQVLSVRGVEYTMMTLLLWFSAGALLWMLLALINGLGGFEVLSFPLALLLVCLPGFAYLFIRLKRAEVANPQLRFDASKRRLSQFTQIIAFATCLFNVIAVVFSILQSISGESVGSLGKMLLNLLVVLAVAGGILVYYWVDEHRLTRR